MSALLTPAEVRRVLAGPPAELAAVAADLAATALAQAERIAALEHDLAAARATLRGVDRREGWR